MNTSFSACVLAGAAVLTAARPAAVLAQTPTPAASLPPAAAPRKELLRLKFTVGQTLYYRRTEDTAGSYLEPHGKLTPIKSHLEMQEHQTVTDRRDTDNAALIDVGVDSMTVILDGKPVPPTDDREAVKANLANLAVMANLAKLIVLPSGKMEETLVNPALNADEVLAGEDPAHMNALAGLGELPETPVGVGDRWKSPVFLGLISEKSTADLLLTGWETKDAASIAVIKQAIRGRFGVPTDAAKPLPGDMKITGWVSGTRTVRFNVEAGTVESEDSLSYMTVMMTPRGDDGKFTEKPTRIWIKVTSKLKKTDAPPAAPAAKTP